MPGTLVPPHYVPKLPNSEELSDAGVIWGMSLSLTLFALIRCFLQAYAEWGCIWRVDLYMVLIWLELWSSTLIGVMYFAYMRGNVPPSFWFFGGTVLLWAIQVQCLYQIILNRVGLITDNAGLVRRLKWAVFGFIVFINIAVSCIWIPAQLQVSERHIQINQIWEPTEKVILAIIDVGMNLYFIYLVRSRLVARGLSRYVTLYRVNIFMIGVSMAMDVLIITLNFFNNIYFIYIFFHPLTYLVKLHIELSMADLIAKLVKIGGITRRCNCECHREPRANVSGFAPTIGRLSNWAPIQQYRVRHRINGPSFEPNLECEPTRPSDRRVVVREPRRRPMGDTWASSVTRNSISSLGRTNSANPEEELGKIHSSAVAEEAQQSTSIVTDSTMIRTSS